MHGTCVLLDDDADFRLLMERLLAHRRPGLACVSFSNGIDALDYLAGHQADFVITDFRMPIMDGLQFISHLRTAGRRVPIVMISGNGVASEALAAGANAFLSKADIPAKLDEVLRLLGG
jgi:CheY-like chemotaxis protein